MLRLRFTVEEANLLLPMLEQTLGKITAKKVAAGLHYDQLQLLDTLWGEDLVKPANPDRTRFQQHRDSYRNINVATKALVRREISQRGLRFPPGGLEQGLIDFPTTLDGRWVYLCWQSGEAQVYFWHELDGGFAGRHKLLDEHRIVMGHGDFPSDENGLDF